MSNIFGNLSTDGLEEAQDRLGGSRIIESGPLTGTIKLAYAGKATNSDARSVTIVLLPDDNGSEYRETFWVTNRDGKNYYEKDGKKHPLPGFTVVDDLCIVTTNKALAEQQADEKVINVYNFDEKKEISTSVPMLVNLLGKKVTLGIQKHLKNKQQKNNAGVYEDIADEREENVTDKVFHHPSNMTVAEAKRGLTDAVFYGLWCEKNTGVTQDRRSIKGGATGVQSGRPGRPAGAPPQANDSGKKTTSLFGNAA